MVHKGTNSTFKIGISEFDAFIFDLDGVVTATASVHAVAWKKMFDEFLSRYAKRTGSSFEQFDPKADYLEYVDGKPRIDGIKSFLNARQIELPEGSPDDAADKETLYGLGNLKNQYFLEHLEQKGPQVYASTVNLIRKLKQYGLKTAIISSSKNCLEIIKTVHLTKLFDVRVDGVISEELGIRGKPAPDIFLEAARRLNVEPKQAVVVEDAISGVQAGREANFGLVIGIARTGSKTDLLENGADVAVEDLAEIQLTEDTDNAPDLPSALQHIDRIAKQAETKQITVFLDYDGTLTPIVDTPDKAILADAMRKTVIRLSEHCTVGIISGRDLEDVKDKVKIDSIVYAGSHGFDIAGPSGLEVDNQVGAEFLPSLDNAEKMLTEKLDTIKGVAIERKKFAIAVHYRLAAPDRADSIEAVVDEVAARYENLRKARGKKIFELQPKMDWHKGKALFSLLETLGLDRNDVLPIYLGDDVTDEDAFRSLRGRGIGIVVWDEPYPTAASYCLDNPDQVGQFLNALIPLCKKG